MDRLGNGVTADEAVPLALFSFCRWAPDFTAVVRRTTACGGDTDTIAAMSGALAGGLVGEEAIPERWLGNVDAEELDRTLELADAIAELHTDRS